MKKSQGTGRGPWWGGGCREPPDFGRCSKRRGRSEGFLLPSTLLRPHPPSTTEAGAGQAPREEAVSLAPGPAGAVGQGWMTGAGPCLVVIRSSQGTEAMSCPLGLAAIRWQQAHSLLRSSRALPADMIAVPTAWCSVALALLVALHEGEPSGLACFSSNWVCSAVSPRLSGLRWPASYTGTRSRSPAATAAALGASTEVPLAAQGSGWPVPPGLPGLSRAGPELPSS